VPIKITTLILIKSVTDLDDLFPLFCFYGPFSQCLAYVRLCKEVKCNLCYNFIETSVSSQNGSDIFCKYFKIV
jgi:hypothetical protein